MGEKQVRGVDIGRGGSRMGKRWVEKTRKGGKGGRQKIYLLTNLLVTISANIMIMTGRRLSRKYYCFGDLRKCCNNR